MRQNTGYNGADGVLDRLRQSRDEDDTRIAVGDLRQRFYDDVRRCSWRGPMRAVDSRFDIGEKTDPDEHVAVAPRHDSAEHPDHHGRFVLLIATAAILPLCAGLVS